MKRNPARVQTPEFFIQIPTIKHLPLLFWIIIFVFLFPACNSAYESSADGDSDSLEVEAESFRAGDPDGLEENLVGRTDVIFFSGFENDPWQDVWGMEWGPSPEEHFSIISGTEAFSDHALRVEYPAGGYGSEDSGGEFVTRFELLGIEPQDCLHLRYYVRFADDFDFVKGGKLPGLAGGEHNSGGLVPDGTDGWSARIMWREDGRLAQYVYYPEQADIWGDYFYWTPEETARLIPGRWHCLESAVCLNTPGEHDGSLRAWLDGTEALQVDDLRFRDVADLGIDVLYFSSFFGGGDEEWAAAKDEYAVFDNFVMATEYIGCTED